MWAGLQQADHELYTVNKKHKRIMRFGMLCATLQLGTAFAAFRALRSSKERQRLAAMDLRSGPRSLSTFSKIRLFVLWHCAAS